MVMNKNIARFVEVVRYKNGRNRIRHNSNNENNIYALLKEFGYRSCTLDNRRCYFLKKENELVSVSFLKIKDRFHDFLENQEYVHLPDDIHHFDIMEWYYGKNPIKETRLFKYLMTDINSQEAHKLRLITDAYYKHNNKIEILKNQLIEWGFIKIKDAGSNICKHAPLYHKNVEANKYLVFTHFATDIKYADGFDCWLANFNRKTDIGKKPPVYLKHLKLSFDLEDDFHLIQRYVN